MNRPKPILDNKFYHVYNRGNNKQPIFRRDKDYIFFLKRLAEYCQRYSVRVGSYCLMPNHYHAILCQASGGSIASLMGTLGTSTAKNFNARYGNSGHPYEGPYHYKLVDSNEYLLHLSRYIHVNPVIAGLSEKPDSWPWSNYLFFANAGSLLHRVTVEEGYLPSWCCDIQPVLQYFNGQKKLYREFVQEYAEDQLEIIRDFLVDLR